MKKLMLSALLFTLALLLLLSGCQSRSGGTETGESTVSETESETAQKAPDDAPIVFARGVETQYVIIQGKNADPVEEQAAVYLQSAFEACLGLTVPVRIDLIMESAGYVESPYEILVGQTNRSAGDVWDESARSQDYCIRKSGTKLVLQGVGTEGTREAVNEFVRLYLSAAREELRFTDDDSRTVIGDYPVPSFTVDGVELLDFQLVYDSLSAPQEFSAVALAETLTVCYGYSVEAVPSYRVDADRHRLRLMTVAEAPGLAALLGSSSACLTVYEGNPVLAAKDALSLLEAVKCWCAELGTQGPLALKSGSVARTFQTGNTLSSMSFNLYGTTDFSGRKNAVLNVISIYLPDTLGIQEGKAEWVSLFAEKLDGIYSCVGIGNAEAGYTETYNNIYYKTDKYTLIEGGTIWLSDNINEAGSKFTESKRVRTATYALLECKDSGKRVLYVNTHLDNQSATAREKQVMVLMKFLSGFDAPCVLTGDFNSGMSSNVYSIVTTLMQDSRTDAAERSNAPTYNGLGGSTSVLDYCFFTEDCFDLLTYRVNTALWQGSVYPSDHNAIYTEYRIK